MYTPAENVDKDQYHKAALARYNTTQWNMKIGLNECCLRYFAVYLINVVVKLYLNDNKKKQQVMQIFNVLP